MWEKTHTNLSKSKLFTCADLRESRKVVDSVSSRHEGVQGFNQEIYSRSTITLVGAGGINGENGEGFVRKGIGQLHIFDGDLVEISNLNRQKFTKKDIGKNKALRLAKNLKREGYMGTKLRAYPLYFQQAVEEGYRCKTDLIVCGVDNDQTRIYVSTYALTNNLPAIFAAVSRDANQGYAFVQEINGACFGCAFPESISNDITPCPGVPAIKDILKIVSGFLLYAADTILMQRKRDWNFRMTYLAGYLQDIKRLIHRKEDCTLCSSQEQPDK